MIELEKLQDHLQTLKKDDWDRLFLLLPEIEATKEFSERKGGEILEDGSLVSPYWNPVEIVEKVFHLIHELDIVPAFDWMAWYEARAILNNEAFDYSTLDTITLCKLLTVIVRADRFNDGFLVANFKNKVIPKIIEAIKQNET